MSTRPNNIKSHLCYQIHYISGHNVEASGSILVSRKQCFFCHWHSAKLFISPYIYEHELVHFESKIKVVPLARVIHGFFPSTVTHLLYW